METAMGNLGSPRLHYLESFVTNVSNSLCSIQKTTNTNRIIMPLCSAYLLADWAANFAVGLISNSQGSPRASSSQATENEDLLSFWAPFLLVHLGGYDTITAFAMEDNELWLRHLLGIIKYAERTRSLYLASADRFKDSMFTGADPGPNYAKLMDEYFSKRRAKLPTRIEMVPEPDRAVKSSNKAKKGNLTELEVIQYAYRFFQIFKGLVLDLISNRKERNQSRDFFLNRTAKDAFKVVERWFCLAIVLFTFKNKSNFRTTDVTITYCLLYGALALDVSAIFMLVFSDWTIISLRESTDEELN
nr:hypothetical protein [Tanacetum cinerariifolium]